jgi:hypothetical protein
MHKIKLQRKQEALTENAAARRVGLKYENRAYRQHTLVRTCKMH